MRTLLTILTALMLLVAPAAATVAMTQASVIQTGFVEHVPDDDAVMRQGGCTTLGQAVEQVRRQYNGRIVSAETKVNGGRETHIVKVLTSDGKVKTVRIPGCRV